MSELQDSSCLERNHTGLSQQVHFSAARQPCSPSALQPSSCISSKHTTLRVRLLGLSQSPSTSWWASRPRQAAKTTEREVQQEPVAWMLQLRPVKP